MVVEHEGDAGCLTATILAGSHLEFPVADAGSAVSVFSTRYSTKSSEDIFIVAERQPCSDWAWLFAAGYTGRTRRCGPACSVAGGHCFSRLPQSALQLTGFSPLLLSCSPGTSVH
jgi:hypothetical protein